MSNTRNIKTDEIESNSTNNIKFKGTGEIQFESGAFPNIAQDEVIIRDSSDNLVSSGVPISSVTKNNLDTVDPTTQGSNEGYSLNSRWFNETTSVLWILIADTSTAADIADFMGQVAGMTTDVTIEADNTGTTGNSVSLAFDGIDDIATVLAAWNLANPGNTATVIAGDTGQVPDNLEVINLAGGLDAVDGGTWSNVAGFSIVEDTLANIIAASRIDGQIWKASNTGDFLADDGTTLTSMNNLKETFAVLNALPRFSGRIVIATDQNNAAYLDNGTALVSVGSGGGGVDVYFQDDFEVTTASDFNTGNDADLNGGVITAAPVDETVSPIQGLRSIKHIQVSGSLNDYFDLSYSIGVREQGKANQALAFATSTGDDGDWRFYIYNDTDGVILDSGPVPSTTSADRLNLLQNVPESCDDIRIGFQVVVENIGATLIFDLFELNTNPMALGVSIDPTEWTDYTPSTGLTGGTLVVNGKYRLVGSELQGRIDVDTSGGIFTGGTFSFGLPAGFSADTSQFPDTPVASRTKVGEGIYNDSSNAVSGDYHATVYYNDATSVITRHGTTINGNTYVNHGNSTTGLPFSWATNDTISFFFSVPVEQSSTTNFFTQYVDQSWTAFTPAVGSGFGTITNASGFYKVIGDSLSVEMSFDCGTVAASTAEFDLPESGHLVDFSKISNSNKNALGFGNHLSGAVFDGARGMVVFADGTNDDKLYLAYTAGGTTLTKFNVNSNIGSSNGITIRYEVPILGGNTQQLIVPAIKTMFVKRVESNNTVGGTIPTTGAYFDLTLNTLEGDIYGSLASSILSIPSGKYNLTGWASAFACNRCKIKLLNFSDTTDEIIGDSSFHDTGGTDAGKMPIAGGFTIEAGKDYKLQMYAESSGGGTRGLGYETNAGDNEIYVSLKFDKLL